MMIANNDPELYKWLSNAMNKAGGGSFVYAVARAAFQADSENYMILRPALLQLKKKYPAYD